jgi:hypothetical protein
MGRGEGGRRGPAAAAGVDGPKSNQQRLKGQQRPVMRMNGTPQHRPQLALHLRRRVVRPWRAGKARRARRRSRAAACAGRWLTSSSLTLSSFESVKPPGSTSTICG